MSICCKSNFPPFLPFFLPPDFPPLPSSFPFPSGSSFLVQIGAGGASPGPQTGYHGPPGGNPGDNSVVAFPAGTITSYGGGAGSGGNYNGDAGGSGGGGNGGYARSGGPSPYTPQQGFGGGAGSGNPSIPPEKYGGGGGGGAGGAGADAQISDPTNFAGSGGLGVQLPSTFQDPTSRVGQSGPGSTNYWVAGGGSGGTFNNESGPGTAKGGTGPVPTASTDGPFAGGGNGSNSPGVDGTSGDENTGGGGGGGFGFGAPSTNGGHGGSGIVLIAYPTT